MNGFAVMNVSISNGFSASSISFILRKREISTDSTIRNRTKICLKRNEQPSHLNLVQLVLIITNFKWLYHIKTHDQIHWFEIMCSGGSRISQTGTPTDEFEASTSYRKIFVENRIKIKEIGPREGTRAPSDPHQTPPHPTLRFLQ